MKFEINIPDRLYEEIKEMCDFNDEPLEKYFVDCISDTYYTLKYGDLNQKLEKKSNNKVKKKVVTTEEKPIEKKKVGRPRKKTEEKTETPVVDENVLKNNNDTILKNEDTVVVVDTELQNKIKRTRRTLKTK